MVRITYLKHSGFVVEYDSYVLIFDYYQGVLPEFEKDKTVLVFVSHAHYDHFQKSIFEWMNIYPKIHYILSSDVLDRKVVMKNREVIEPHTTVVEPHEDFCIQKARIRTLRSTDEGVAFLVDLGNKTFYHAGDLNWWHWEEEDDESYNEPMRIAYQTEIDSIEGLSIDYAFLPLDARQEKEYGWGIDYFVHHTDTKVIFPMHMQDYRICDQFISDEQTQDYRERICRVQTPGQVFEFEKE